MSKYIYDQSWDQERLRLAGLEAALDPGTMRILESLGVDKEWRCLEVGGGGGSITRWLTERAGAVVATDLDPRFLKEIDAPNLEVLTHDIVRDPLEENGFDLVHSRDVLEHIPEREAVLDTMVAALKPGGWLVAEDVDFVSVLRAQGFGENDETSALEAKMWPVMTEAMRKRGVDPEFGRRLPWRLRARGLEDIQAEVRGGFAKAGTPAANLAALSVTHLRPLLIESGAVTEDEADRLIARLTDPDFLGFGPLHIAAWGRKPA